MLYNIIFNYKQKIDRQEYDRQEKLKKYQELICPFEYCS